MDILTASVVMAGLTVGLGTLSTGIAQGIAINGAVQGIARQPEASGTIQTNLIIGLAFIESLCIYALVISLLLLFANPFAKAENEVGEAKAKVALVQAEMDLIHAQAQLDTLKKETAPAK